MDPRYKKSQLLEMRRKEWGNLERVRDIVLELFSRTISRIEGYTLLGSEWVRDPRVKRKEEIRSHSYRTLKIKTKNVKEEEEEFPIKIPELVENQFFFIGGFLKVPIFQLIDFPVVYKSYNDPVRIRTNTVTTNLETGKNGYIVELYNKKIPIQNIIAAMYEPEDFEELFSNPNRRESVGAIADLCEAEWNSKSKEERLENLGKQFSTIRNDYIKKGNNLCYSLDLAYNLDIFSQRYMKTDGILKEIIQALSDGPRSDTNVFGKRLRFSEYVLFPLIQSLFDMGISLYTGRNSRRPPKFHIPQGVIIDNINSSASYKVSDIVHFNLCVNPIGEIHSLLQATLTGPGGFKKENVPRHLRTLDDSQFGFICPADTPDRDGCGVIVNLVPNIEINEDGTFKKDGCRTDTPTSYAISTTPFVQNDDQTRLQMASNQAKQSLLLENNAPPFIRSGTEDIYLDHTTFLYRAKEDGEVIHLSRHYMIVLYANGEREIIKPYYRKMYLDSLDYIEPLKKTGDSFKKGETLCQSHFLKDGELALGQNFLTGIVIGKGYNYEDAIVISESAASKLTSRHCIDLSFEIPPNRVLMSLLGDSYKPLPSLGEFIKKGDVYARHVVFELRDKIEDINIEPKELSAPKDCQIINIEIYPNNWNENVNQYDRFVKDMMMQQTNRFNNLKNNLKEHFDEDEAEKFIVVNNLSKLDCVNRKGKYSEKGRTLPGVLFKITGITEDKIEVGDKLSNRHGNKGIVSVIMPDEKMPRMKDGRTMEILINPLGIISRMNCGQLYEISINECLYNLKRKILEMEEKITEENKDSVEKKQVSMIKKFLSILDKTPDKWAMKNSLEKFRKDFEKHGKKTAVENLCIFIPQFMGPKKDDVDKLMKMTGSKYKYELFDPESGVSPKNEIGVGYMYFNKLVHKANSKLSAISLGEYSKKTHQPSDGHRLGEMEVWALLAHGCSGEQSFLKDLLTLHSDSKGGKYKYLSNMFSNDITENMKENPDAFDETPQASLLMENYLKIINIEMTED